MKKRKATSLDKVTKAILDKIENGTLPWMRPWDKDEPLLGEHKNFVTGKRYRGFNSLSLYGNGYKSPNWVTFKKMKELGGSLKKGQKGSIVIFWKILKKTEERDGEEVEKNIPLLRHYFVFNLDQIDGIECPDTGSNIRKNEKEINSIPGAEKIVFNFKNMPSLTHGISQRAFYDKGEDYINMPEKEAFHSSEEYYSTLFHEIVHSTGHKDRLNRDSLVNACGFGDHEYSREELVAEIGSAMLCNKVGFSNKVLDNQAAYVRSWKDNIKKDPTILIWASQKAQKAFDYILNIDHENK